MNLEKFYAIEKKMVDVVTGLKGTVTRLISSGGNTGGYSGSSGGVAINDSGVTYTLTNNGTIYGST